VYDEAEKNQRKDRKIVGINDKIWKDIRYLSFNILSKNLKI